MMPSQSDDRKERTGPGTEIRDPQGGTQPKLDSDLALLSSGSPAGEEAESPGVAPERPETVVGLSIARIEMFSDGVFAIVSTLLVLQIQVPRIPPGDVAESLPRAILAMWPEFLSYAVSFVSVGI